MFSRLTKTTVLVGLLIALGCEVTDSLSSGPTFGDAYAIVPADASPRLDVNGLHLTVQYSGGCRRHAFTVHHRRVDDATEVWLRHDDNGDRCEAFLTETLRLDVSSRVLETASVLLLTPDGSSFPLR